MWTTRKRFWDGLTVAKFLLNRPTPIPVPRDDGRRLEAVALERRHPRIPIRNVRVADHVPADERSLGKSAFYGAQVALYRLYPPMEDGLPPVDEGGEEALRQAYTRAHRLCRRPPRLPAEFRQREVDLGRLAVASPYAGLLERSPEGGWQWDLRYLDRYERHPGLRALGVRVRFGVVGDRLVAEAIDCELGERRPGEPGWDLARRLALCAATTHVSLTTHFNGVHLALGGPLAMAVRNELPARHPLRRLLWPHVYGTQLGNFLVTAGQLSPRGDFEGVFSFTHAGVCRLFEETYEEFDVSVLDPEHDAEDRGILHGGFATPSLDNSRAHFDVIARHVGRYLELYYPTDDALRHCPHLAPFLEALEATIPGGLRKMCPSRGREDVTRLLAAFVHGVTVRHEILGTGLWDYQLWTQVQPVRVARDGRREPLDVFSRLLNANLVLSARRTALMSDFSHLALDAEGARAFATFRRELQGLQAQLEQEPFEAWKMYPELLNANINP